MLRIRLTRKGKKNKAFYRIVLAEAKRPIKGRFIEILGWLDPHQKTSEIKKERVLYWLGQGAQPSDTVRNLFINKGIIKGKKINKFKVKKKKEEGKTKEATPQTKDKKEPKKNKEAENVATETATKAGGTN